MNITLVVITKHVELRMQSDEIFYVMCEIFYRRAELQVGEHIVGAILGPGGKALLEIQHFSGANIQISKKGIYAPGTRNRWVTISGTPNAISTAQYLIEQRISEEEAKRARHHSNDSTTINTTAAILNPSSNSPTSLSSSTFLPPLLSTNIHSVLPL